jgi:MFS family permease
MVWRRQEFAGTQSLAVFQLREGRRAVGLRSADLPERSPGRFGKLGSVDGAALADRLRIPPWTRVATVMFGVGWGANQFSSLLLAYRLHRGVSESTADALFGVYALGLIPALLLIGPISDQCGRRRIVRGAGVLSAAASLALIAGAHSLGMLYLGRFLAGVCSGAAFAAGTAWIKELSVAPYDPLAGEQAGARRAAIGLTAGFGLGPLAAGLLAQWGPDPLLTAYLPHLAVMVIALVTLIGAPETVSSDARRVSLAGTLRVPSAGHDRFRGIVAPAAPWVFAAPSIAFAVLPGLVAHQTGSYQVAFAAVVAGLTLGVGILIQPLARRLDRTGDVRGLVGGLLAVSAGTLLGAVAGQAESWPLVLPAAALLGGGYGLCIVSGLLETQRLASREDLASLTAIYYALTYVGFAVPIILAEFERIATAPVLLLLTAALAAVSAGQVRRSSAQHPPRLSRRRQPTG